MRILTALALSLALATPAIAAFEGPGTTQAPVSGFQGPQTGAAINSVTMAMQARDDAYCTLEGRLTEKLAGHKDLYMFEDASGRMVVDIDDEKFAGRVVTPQNTVRLHGEVDVKRSGQREVDVDVLEIIR